MKYTRCRQCGYHLEPGAGQCFNCSIPTNNAFSIDVEALSLADLNFQRFYRQVDDREKQRIHRLVLNVILVILLAGLLLTVFSGSALALMTLVLTAITLFAFSNQTPRLDKLYFLLYYPGFKKHWQKSLLRAEQELKQRISKVETQEKRLTAEIKNLKAEPVTESRRRIVKGLHSGLLFLQEIRGQYRIKLYEIYLTRLNNALHYQRDTLDQVQRPEQFESRIAAVESLLTTCRRYRRDWPQEETSSVEASQLSEVLGRLEEQLRRLRHWLVDHRAIATLREVSLLDAPIPPPLFPEESINTAIGQATDDHIIHSLNKFWKDYRKVDRELDRIEFEKELLDRWKPGK